MSIKDILQRTLEYIDSNLCGELDVEIIAAYAGFSPYHFSRVFRFSIGYSVMEYVRLRRLAFAASQLGTGEKIIDIALRYGFETHSGFSKAFRRVYGCAPERYRAHAQKTRPSLPSLEHLEQYVRRGIIMGPKFVTLDAIKIAGYAITTVAREGISTREIPQFWKDCIDDGRLKRLHGESFIKNHDEFGACFPEDHETGMFAYVIGIEVREGADVPEGYAVYELPCATYAVFSSPPVKKEAFSESIQGTWNYIYNEWFPDSGYEYADGCVDFELYGEKCMGDTDNVCDIYIPVKKR